MCRLSLVVESGGYTLAAVPRASDHRGVAHGFESSGSVVVVHRVSCPVA